MMRRPREATPPAQGTQAFWVTHETRIQGSCPPAKHSPPPPHPQASPKIAVSTATSFCALTLILSALRRGMVLAPQPWVWVPSFFPEGSPTHSPDTWSGPYQGAICGLWYTDPKLILRARWQQVRESSLRRKGGRGLQGRKGLSGPHTETGSTHLTEAPLMGLVHGFQNGCSCPCLSNNI